MLLFCDIVTMQLFRENVTMGQEKITLTKAELKKVLVVEKLVQIKVAEAAELLEEHESLMLSASSVRRILLDQGIKQAKQRSRI